MYVKKKNFFFFFTKPITDYGKMLKYREKYRSTDISVDLYFSPVVRLSSGNANKQRKHYYARKEHFDVNFS